MEGTETNQGPGREDNKNHPIPATERRQSEKKGQSLWLWGYNKRPKVMSSESQKERRKKAGLKKHSNNNNKNG